MNIPSYKIHNVIKVFSEQLCKNVIAYGNINSAPKPPIDKIVKSPEGKRQSIISKISADIVNKISHSGLLKNTEHEKNNYEKKSGLLMQKEIEFIYNYIDEKNIKKTNKLSITDASTLVKELEYIIKETID